MTWRKGCLCGCLYPEECRYHRPPVQIVHVVHYYTPAADPDVIDAEWVVVQEVGDKADRMAD